MIGYTTNTHGRYKCDFCDHDTYKTMNGILMHLQDHHYHEAQEARLLAEIERLKNLPPKIEIKEKIVYQDPPKKKEQKYWNIEDIGAAGIYCTSCKMAQFRIRMPVGQTIENTPHSICGNKTLMLIMKVS